MPEEDGKMKRNDGSESTESRFKRVLRRGERRREAGRGPIFSERITDTRKF